MKDRSIGSFSIGPILYNSSAKTAFGPVQFGPVLANRLCVEGNFSASSTSGTAFKVLGMLSSASTAPFTVATIAKANTSVNTPSTVAKVLCWLKITSTVGTWSATKFANICIAGGP